MKTMTVWKREGQRQDPVELALTRIEDVRSQLMSKEDLRRLWLETDPEGPLEVLTAFIKSHLRVRIEAGEQAAASDYFEVFPELLEDRERVVSVVYEEYCLYDEHGQAPDTELFYERYERWRDSFEAQLNIHRIFTCKSQQSEDLQPMRFPVPGDDFQSFHLRSLLGKGGAARVFLALDRELGDREVALKISRDHGKEPSILGRLNHPHIVPVLSVKRDLELGLRGMCMPYQPGLPLNKVVDLLRVIPGEKSAKDLWTLARNTPTSRSNETKTQPQSAGGWNGYPIQGSYSQGVAWIAMTLAEALHCAHSRGVLHQDVKPANVLLAASEGPQLLDFNMARFPDSVDQATAAVAGGTLPYMAPEQLDALLDGSLSTLVREPADVFALGLVMRELLLLKSPELPRGSLPVSRAVREMKDRRSIPLQRLRECDPSIPHALDAIERKCLAPAPKDRYASAAELAEDLAAFLAFQNLPHAVNPSRTERTVNWAIRNKRIGLIAATVFFSTALAVLIGWQAYLALTREGPTLNSRVAAAIRTGHLSEARRALDSSDAKGSTLWLALDGVVLWKEGSEKEAIERFRLAAGSPDELSAFRAAAAAAPNLAAAHEQLAWALVRADRNQEAIESFRKASELDKSFNKLNRIARELETKEKAGWEELLRGMAWFATGKDRDKADRIFVDCIGYYNAEDLFKIAVDVSPATPPLWTSLGWVFWRANPEEPANKEAAKSAFEKALKLDSENPAHARECSFITSIAKIISLHTSTSIERLKEL